MPRKLTWLAVLVLAADTVLAGCTGSASSSSSAGAPGSAGASASAHPNFVFVPTDDLNSGSDGGYGAYMSHDDEQCSFAPALQKAGYRTAMMGKYLNGYQPTDPIPPGWNEWDVTGNGYPEFNYTLNEDGKQEHYGHMPKDYLTQVLSGRASSFIGSAASAASRSCSRWPPSPRMPLTPRRASTPRPPPGRSTPRLPPTTSCPPTPRPGWPRAPLRVPAGQ